MKAQSKSTYTKQKYVWSPIPCPSGTEQPLGFTSWKSDAVNTMESKKPFLYFYFLGKKTKQNKKLQGKKAKCFQEFFPSFLTVWLIWLLFEFHLRQIFAPI